MALFDRNDIKKKVKDRKCWRMKKERSEKIAILTRGRKRWRLNKLPVIKFLLGATR